MSNEPVPPVIRELLFGDEAMSADPELPAFLARPNDAPAYHGFLVIAESEVDGWLLGMITEFGVEGDGFVIAPDGARAGLVWMAEGAEYFRSGGPEFCTEVLGPDEGRWGVFSVGVPLPLRDPSHTRSYLAALLPWLRPIWATRASEAG